MIRKYFYKLMLKTSEAVARYYRDKLSMMMIEESIRAKIA